MKLYYTPGTCSLSPHILLRELDLPFDLVRVDNRSKRTADGGDFLAINPKGYVAALEIDDGRVLTEGPAISQYLADLRPDAGLVPPAGNWARSQLHEWLNFISAEIHGGFGPLFNRDLPEAARVVAGAAGKAPGLRRRQFAGAAGAGGDRYGIADIYLYAVLRWAPQLDVELARWPVLVEFQQRIDIRPAVQAALAAEARG